MKDFGSQSGFGFTDTMKSASQYTHKSCHESHPPLQLGDTGLVIYGGSGNYPKVKDADVYIGFDYGMERPRDVWPWEKPADKPNAVHVYYPITDMSVPKSVGDFKKLINWTIEQLKAGKKVHAGCIGGHGRTGTFFSALVKTMLDIEDSTTYVREGYCEKAVESSEQVQWLHKHFGVKVAKGYKEGKGFGGGYSGGGKSSSKSSGVGHSLMPGSAKNTSGSAKSYQSVASKKSIWGNAKIGN